MRLLYGGCVFAGNFPATSLDHRQACWSNSGRRSRRFAQKGTLHVIPNAQSSSSPASLLSVSLQGATERPVNVAVDYWPELTRPHRSQSGACTVALRLQRSLRCAKRQITVDGIKVCLCHHRSLSRLDQSSSNRDRVARQTHAGVGLELSLVTPV